MITFLSWGFNTFAGGWLWRNGKRTTYAVCSLLTVFGYGFAVIDGWMDENKIVISRGIVFGKLRFEKTGGSHINDWRGGSIRSLIRSLTFWDGPKAILSRKVRNV